MQAADYMELLEVQAGWPAVMVVDVALYTQGDRVSRKFFIQQKLDK